MERPALATAIGCASAIVAVLALVGVLDTSIIVVALLAIAIRAAAASLNGSPLALSRAAAAVLPFAALASIAVWRAGAPTLDAVRGANAILGAAALTTPASFAIATVLSAVAVVLVTAGQTMALRETHIIGSVLDRLGILVAAMFVATVVGGPDMDGARSLIAWTALILLTLLAMRAAEQIARHAALMRAAGAVALLAVIVGAFG